MSSRTTHLYRLWNADGELLYIGISKSAMRRLTDHQKGKSWGDEVSQVTIENVATRAEAERLEADAIASERPKYNVTHAHKATNEERLQMQWHDATQEQRADALGIVRKLAVQMAQFPGNSARDERIAAYLALSALSLEPASDIAALNPTRKATR